MDFVQWCGALLGKLLELQEATDMAAVIGLRADELAPGLLGAGWERSPQVDAITQALTDLEEVGVVEHDPRMPQELKIPRPKREQALDQRELWAFVCAQPLGDDEARLLRVLNRLSERPHAEFAYLEVVPYESLYPELGLDPGYEAELFVDRQVRNLQDLGFARFEIDLAARATYRGLVWEHRRGVTESSAEIDALVEEGETATVDLKRQLGIATKSEKAELVKDVIALANTKATGRRYLLVGFTDEGDYYEPDDPQERAERDRLLDALTEDRLQTVVAEYTAPSLRIRYTRAEYHRGPVGKLEVLRDLTEIPYAVRKTVGSADKTDGRAWQVREGQIFVRDGAVTREARREEVERMRADAERAKRRRNE